MQASDITMFIQSPENFWVILGLGLFLIMDGVVLGYLINNNYLKTRKKKTSFSHKLLLTSAMLTAVMGGVVILAAFSSRYF